MSSFQEIYKTSYSHGLEQIYKLENVDLKSVKRLEVKQEIKAEAFKSSDVFLDELDLGEGFRLWIAPSVFDEPIQVLDLNRHVEKCLLDQGLTTLKHLYETDLSKFVYVKGMGQGHIDELKGKLQRYLDSKPLKRQGTVDFRSWILSLFAHFSPRESVVILEPYRLEKWINLSPLDQIEVRKLAPERKEEIREQAKLHFELFETTFRKKFLEIESSFIKPWIAKREGMASFQEVKNFLLLKADNEEEALSSFSFFSDYFEHLIPEKVYFSDPETEELFGLVEQLGLTYFWTSEAYYPFEQLYRFLSHELAKKFYFLSEIRFFRMMELSCTFHLYRQGEQLFVELQ